MLLTGDMLNAADAKDAGLISRIVTQEELLNTCREILTKIAQKSPLAVAQILKLVNRYYDAEQGGFETEISEFADCFDTEDFKEGVSAFLEKRKAQFTGR